MKNLIVSQSPHVHSGASTTRIMRDVIIALLPTTVAGAFLFGWRAIVTVAVCVITAILSEFVFNILTKRKQTIGDFSAALTGLLLGLNLSTNVTIWQCIIGSVFAIIVVKSLFGGLGCNFANPAITARVFLLAAFSSSVAGGATPVDLEAGATPLAAMKSGVDLDTLPSLLDMFLGKRGGAIGEACIAALVIGFIYLVIRRVIHFETPLIFIGTVYVLTLAITADPLVSLYQILSGGLFLGAIFMATDYVTTPITRVGKMIFALGCGLITVLIRFFGTYPEGVSFAILIMNILSPYIDKWTQPRPLGKVGKA